ncbi:MAG: N-acetylneuraminate synthase family protein, partial [Thermodesulfobacteriota bacterium]|nr:N-acetylneuraminate synthase family protein [Thermodesulfobacteriota bacterium]
PCFIVAEIGNNHQGDIAVARKMVKTAAEIGVNAVKFQKRHTGSLLSREGLDAPYTGPNSFGRTYGEHRDALELNMEEMKELKVLSESLGLVFFASAWDQVSLGQMLDIDMEVLKICSADLVNVPLLRQAGAANIPIILSTGMSTLEEIDRAVAELRRFHDQIVLLHCNSSYPCPEEEICLPVMNSLKERYGLLVGYSGHERGIGPSVGAVALGACVVERHFTLDKNMRGTDHVASLEPDGFVKLVTMIREVETASAHWEKKVFEGEANAAKKLRKSIVAARDLKSGMVLGPGDITVKSPGTGVSPLEWDDMIGARLLGNVKKDQMILWDMVSAAPVVRPEYGEKVVSLFSSP